MKREESARESATISTIPELRGRTLAAVPLVCAGPVDVELVVDVDLLPVGPVGVVLLPDGLEDVEVELVDADPPELDAVELELVVPDPLGPDPDEPDAVELDELDELDELLEKDKHPCE